jgi:hypothetical protein
VSIHPLFTVWRARELRLGSIAHLFSIASASALEGVILRAAKDLSSAFPLAINLPSRSFQTTYNLPDNITNSCYKYPRISLASPLFLPSRPFNSPCIPILEPSILQTHPLSPAATHRSFMSKA